MINLALLWIKVDRDQSKIIIKYKTILQGLVRQRVQGRNYDTPTFFRVIEEIEENANLHSISSR